MNKAFLFSLTVLAGAVFTPESLASDHVDGVKTALDNSADITDLYTFMSPSDPNKLVMIMNVHPLASRIAQFSDSVDYVFRIRPIEDAKRLTPSSDPRKERSVVCSFRGDGRVGSAKQSASCKFNLGSATPVVSFDTRTSQFTAGGSGERDGIRVFAGARSDSWFLDLSKTVKFVNGIDAGKAGGRNGLNGQNVLSIVVEIDKQKLGGPLLAITGQTVRR